MTTNVQSMIDARAQGAPELDKATLAECIQACFECAQTCTACADACLSEDTAAQLAACIRTSLDCVDACVATGKILSRHQGRDGQVTRAVVEACRAACTACADECAGRGSMHQHCQACADASRRCEQACNHLLAALGQVTP